MGRGIQMVRRGFNLFRDNQIETPNTMPMSAHTGRRSSPGAGLSGFSERNIVNAVVTRMSVDAAGVEFFHADMKNGVPVGVRDGWLQNLLSLSANIDQSAFDLKVDFFYHMFDTGYAAIVPTDMTADPSKSTNYEIDAWRVGRIVGMSPRHVVVEVWDDRDPTSNPNFTARGGIFRQHTLPKEQVLIVQNPFYPVMNEPNGLLQRLQRKINILDQQAEEVGSRKLDLIFQLPYTVRSDKRAELAEKRRRELAEQMRDDDLGIGYIDVSEKVIQLNRPINSSLLTEVQDLTAQTFTQLGLSPEILNNTAAPNVVNMYFDRTIEPAVVALQQEMKRKLLSKTAITQGQSIEIYRDPLKLIPLEELAEIADKLTRNAIITSNEFRPKIGFFPSADPRADKLFNPNMPDEDQGGNKEGGKDDGSLEPPKVVDP